MDTQSVRLENNYISLERTEFTEYLPVSEYCMHDAHSTFRHNGISIEGGTLISIRRLFKSRFQISLLLCIFEFEYIMHSYMKMEFGERF